MDTKVNDIKSIKCFSALPLWKIISVLSSPNIASEEVEYVFKDILGDEHSRHHLIGQNPIAKYRIKHRSKDLYPIFKKLAKSPLNPIVLKYIINLFHRKEYREELSMIGLINTICLNININAEILANEYKYIMELLESSSQIQTRKGYRIQDNSISQEIYKAYIKINKNIISELKHSPYLKAKDLEKLCYDENLQIRNAVALNANCPREGQIASSLNR